MALQATNIFSTIPGSASTASTKSATMELYVTSSYNETMSGGETLSSLSEKSCISGVNHLNGDFLMPAYLVGSFVLKIIYMMKKTKK